MTMTFFSFQNIIIQLIEIKKAVPSLPPLPQALQPSNSLPKILTHLRAYNYDSNNNMVRNMNTVDDGLCKLCERDDRSVFCKSCGNEWKVI